MLLRMIKNQLNLESWILRGNFDIPESSELLKIKILKIFFASQFELSYIKKKQKKRKSLLNSTWRFAPHYRENFLRVPLELERRERERIIRAQATKFHHSVKNKKNSGSESIPFKIRRLRG